jgi:hypothetical protein
VFPRDDHRGWAISFPLVSLREFEFASRRFDPVCPALILVRDEPQLSTRQS